MNQILKNKLFNLHSYDKKIFVLGLTSILLLDQSLLEPCVRSRQLEILDSVITILKIEQIVEAKEQRMQLND